MSGDPNLQIDPNKPVPAPDNILHQFTNYTYKISLLSFKSYQMYNDLAENGSWEWCHGNIPSKCNTLISSGGIADSATEFLPARHPAFGLDFYIDTMTTSGVMGMSSTNRATNLFDINISIVEPTGTTLLERLHEVLTEDGPNWTEKPLLIQIDFLGYDDASNPVRIKPATRWIPVRLTTLDFNVTAVGTSYSVEFITMAVLERNSNPLTQALNLKQVKGKTLQDFCKVLEKEFNREQVERSTDKIGVAGLKPNSAGTAAAPKTQEFPDEIEFRLGSGSGPIAEQLKNAKIEPNVAKQTLLREFPTGVTTAGERGRRVSPEGKFKYNRSIRYYGEGDRGDYKVEITAPGQSMLAFLEKVIRDSTYITDQLEENTTLDKMKDAKSVLKNPENGLDWWKITYVKTLKDYDKIRNKYARKTVIQVDPYKVVDPEVTGGKSKPGENGLRSPARSYSYIYTGQNLDIRNLDLTFNNSFIMAMSGIGTYNEGSENPIIKETEANVSPESGNQQDGAAVVSGAQSIKPKSNKFNADEHATQKQRTGATLMENLYRTPGSDMMMISLEIVGDPGYIQQDGILTMTTPNKTGSQGGTEGHDPANGAILCDYADVHFYLVFKTPRDYNEATGLANFAESDGGSTLSGYYRVWEVNSTFQGGEFTQTMNATRIYNQWRENIDNPEKPGEELMSADEAANYDFEDAKAAAASTTTTIAPGSAPAGSAAGEFDGTPVLPLASKEDQKERELASEAADREWAGEFASVSGPVTETASNRNSVNPHADFNIIASQNKSESAAEFRAAEARSFQISTSVESGTLASKLATTPPRLSPVRPNPAEAAGPVKFRASPVMTNVRSSPSFITTTGGGVLPVPKGNFGGTVALDRHPNISTYKSSDQATVRSNDTIMGIERETIINAGIIAAAGAVTIVSATPIGRIIAAAVGAVGVLSSTQLASAWERGNSASEENKIIHNKYGNNVPSWKETGYLLDIISKKDSTTTGGGGGF
jgi:hypothetical protein